MESKKKTIAKRFVLGAACLIFRTPEYKQFLLIKRSHSPCKGAWCLPGGHVEFHEDLIDTMKRELMEETGLEADIKPTKRFW